VTDEDRDLLHRVLERESAQAEAGKPTTESLASPPLDLAQFEGHSPAPWRVVDGFVADHLRKALIAKQIQDARYYAVARVEAFAGDWNVDPSAPADACLIAAAPDLLAEVKRLREVNAYLEKKAELADELHDQAVEALQAATGTPPGHYTLDDLAKVLAHQRDEALAEVERLTDAVAARDKTVLNILDKRGGLEEALRRLVKHGEGCISEPDCGSCKWCDAVSALAKYAPESKPSEGGEE
jgi:hypothetical protein